MRHLPSAEMASLTELQPLRRTACARSVSAWLKAPVARALQAHRARLLADSLQCPPHLAAQAVCAHRKRVERETGLRLLPAGDRRPQPPSLLFHTTSSTGRPGRPRARGQDRPPRKSAASHGGCGDRTDRAPQSARRSPGLLLGRCVPPSCKLRCRS
jgi:hypothetical protein